MRQPQHCACCGRKRGDGRKDRGWIYWSVDVHQRRWRAVDRAEAHTFDVSDLDDARDTAPVSKVALDLISAASPAGNSADGQARHGAAEVAFTVGADAASPSALVVTVTRAGRSVTLLIADDESDEAVAAHVAKAINHAKDEILW